MARYGRRQTHAPIIRHGRAAFVAATFTASYEATGAVQKTEAEPFEAVPSYGSLILSTTGLLDYWRLNETAGNMLDSKGTNPATTVGASVTRGATGLLVADTDKAASGSGSGTTSYINVPTSASMDVTTQLTVELWCRPSAFGASAGNIINRGVDHPWFIRHYTLGDQRWEFNVYDSTSTRISNSGSATALLGVRQHIVMTYDFAAGATALKGYVNGVQVTSAAATANSNLFTGGDVVIGDRFVGAGNAFAGTIDEVALYNTALTAQQVLDHFNVGMQGFVDVYASSVASIEATIPVAATFSLPLEATSAVQKTDTEQYTGLTPIQKTDTARWEATFAVSSAFAVAWEATGGVAAAVAPAWEANTIVALTQAEPYEAPIKLAKLDVENIEAPVALSTTAIANLDATTGIHVTAVGALEALVSLTYSEAQPFESEEVSAQPTSTLVDTFDGPSIDESKWTITGDAHIEGGGGFGELALVGDVDVPDPKIESVLTYTLDALTVQVDPGTDTTEDFSVNLVAAGNPFIGLERTGANQLSFSYTRADGTGGTGGPIAFDHVVMRWWRFKLSGMALTIETSPSRLDGDWTTRFTVSDYDDGGAAYTVQFAAHTYNDGSSDVYPYIYFDNLNFGPIAAIGLPYERLSADLPLTSSLVDDFTGPDVDDSKWEATANAVIEDGRLKLFGDAINPGPSVQSVILYALDSVVFEMERLDASIFDFQLRNFEVSNAYLELSVNEVGSVYCAYQDVDGNFGDNSGHLGTYDATEMRWWQISRSGGGLAFQSSPTGFPGTWTTHLSTPSFDDGQVGYKVILQTSYVFDPDTGDLVYSTVYVDNFNVVPSVVSVSASFELPLESVIPVAATAQQPLEANLGVATAQAFPYEAYLPGSIIASFALSYEAGAKLALALAPLPYEGFVGGIAQTISAPLEATHGLSAALSFPLEAMQGTAPVSAVAILSYEALVPLSATASPAIESVISISALATTYIEARGQVGILIDTEYESIQPAFQLVALSWETIEQFSATLELSWEARGVLVALFELPWISDVRGGSPGHWHQSGKRLVASRGALAVAGSGRADRHSSGHLSRPRTGRKQ